MKTLYIHIGTPKTGTTAIQETCEKNTGLLEKYSFKYPLFKYKFYRKARRRNGNFLMFDCIAPRLINKRIYNESMLKNCLSEIKKAFQTYDNVILSDESGWGRLGKHKLERWKELYNLSKKEGFVVKVIVYLRRQDDWIEAFWNQTVKRMESKRNFEDYYEALKKKNYFDYEKRLKEIADLVGEENIIVRRYGKEYLKDGNVVSDFMNILGIDGALQIDNEKKSNPRLSNNILYLKHASNKVVRERKEMARLMERAAKKASSLSKEERTSILSDEEAYELYKEYEDQNNRVAEKYIGDGKPLFNFDRKGVPKWNIDNEFFVEDASNFVCAIVELLQEKIENNKKK